MGVTETEILTSLAAGNALTAAQVNALMTKIDKGQKRSRAREITASTEIRYAAQIALMTGVEQTCVQQAVTDYSNSSAAINTSCRNGVPNVAAVNIDAMFVAYARIGFAAQDRVTYRLMTFGPGVHVPYGAVAGATINVNDRITDAAFVSASENRQLLVNGVTNPVVGSHYVKMSIVGPGGVNISGGSFYNNANEQAILQQLYPRTWRARTAHAGQAEILYPRDTIFRVRQINQVNNETHVVLSIPAGVGAAPKNSFTGV